MRLRSPNTGSVFTAGSRGRSGSGPARLQHPPRSAVVVAPVVPVQVIQAYGAAAARSVHEAAFADVDPHVADAAAAAEEHQVAGHQALGSDARSLPGEQVAGG